MRASAVALGVLVSWTLPAAQDPAPADLVISGVNVIDVEGGPTRAATLVIRNRTIAALLPPDAAPPASARIDGAGRYVIPGLWDMHVHLAIRPEPALAERIMFPLFLAHGVVGVRDMGGPLDRVLALREGVESGQLRGPRVLTPGPFVDGPGDPDAMFRRVGGADDARDAVRALAAAGADFVKVQANLLPQAHDALSREARDAGIVLAGHVPMAMSAVDAIAAGQRSIEHISPALPGDAGLLFACSNREDALRRELLAIERVRPAAEAAAIRAREAALRTALIESYDPARAAALGATLRQRGTWMVPTLIWSNTFRPLDRRADGSDVPLEYVPAGTRTRWIAARTRYLETAPDAQLASAAAVAAAAARAVGALHEAGAPVLAGTDTYDAFVLPGTSLHQELALLVSAGLAPLEALRSATRNAAAYRGVLDREGTIARGKRADLVVLDADPLADIRNAARVHAVIAGGDPLDRSALDRLLEAARAAAR